MSNKKPKVIEKTVDEMTLKHMHDLAEGHAMDYFSIKDVTKDTDKKELRNGRG